MHTPSTFAGAGTLLLFAAVLTTGCATKKYVQQQTTPTRQRIEELDKKHGQALAQLEIKEQRDVSRVEERVLATENKANDAARAAQAADQKAIQAREAAQKAALLAQANQAKLAGLADALGNFDNYKVFHTEEILFGFNRSTLNPEGRARLDQFVQKTSGLNRYVIEVEGFSDKAGAPDYNLALSRRRADEVVRYLVDHGVPLRRVHMIGLGSQQPQMTAGAAAESADTTRAARTQQRRVVVKAYAP